MKLNLSIEFNDALEMKQFMSLPYPFGAFDENIGEVQAADAAVDDVKKAKKSGKKKSEETAPAPIPEAPVEPVPMVAAPAPAPAPVESALASAIQQAAPAPVAPAPAPVASAPAPVPAAPVAAPASYTPDDLARAAAGLVDAGKQAEVVAVVQKYGVQSLPELPAAQYAAFAADLRAIGGAI